LSPNDSSQTLNKKKTRSKILKSPGDFQRPIQFDVNEEHLSTPTMRGVYYDSRLGGNTFILTEKPLESNGDFTMHNDWLNGSNNNQPIQKKDRRHTHVERNELKKIQEEIAKKAEEPKMNTKGKMIGSSDLDFEVNNHRLERIKMEIIFYSKKIYEFDGF
jgi:hypothetical protein